MSDESLEEIKPEVKTTEVNVEETKPVKKTKTKPVNKVADFIKRLETEKTELDIKVRGLYTFTRSPMEGVTDESRRLLHLQLDLMQQYSKVLGARLKILK